MHKHFYFLSVVLSVALVTVAQASLKPGEKQMGATLVKETSRTMTVILKKTGKEYTFKKSRCPKFQLNIDRKKGKLKDYMKVQEANGFHQQTALIYVDPKKFDKDKNADFKGYEIRRMGGLTHEQHKKDLEERGPSQKSKR